MMKTLVLAAIAATASGTALRAADAPALAAPVPTLAAPLPTLAAEPPPPPSIWKGLYVGSEVFVVAQKGEKARVGGGAYMGYDHLFANNVLLGVQGSVGYTPYTLFGVGRGYDVATIDTKVGYAMGRLTPYVTGSLILAKPNAGPGLGFSANDTINDLLGRPGTIEAAPRVGAGVAYAITPDLSVDFGVSVGRGTAALLP